MIATAQCTIYHNVGNSYIRSVYACHWQDTQADTVNTTGLINQGSVTVYIPSSYSLSDITPTKDLIIKGNVDVELTSTTEAEVSAELKKLKATHAVKVIMSIDNKTYGMVTGHYKLTAK